MAAEGLYKETVVGEIQITYEILREAMRKGLRNRNWRRLSMNVRIHSIINAHIVEMLYETPASRIFKRGFEKALKILSEGVKNPLRKWIKDPEFIFWLGTCSRLSPEWTKFINEQLRRINKLDYAGRR